MFNECIYMYLIRTWLNFMSNFLDQNNPQPTNYCKNELIHIRDFEAIQKNLQSWIIRCKNSRLHLEFLNR